MKFTIENNSVDLCFFKEMIAGKWGKVDSFELLNNGIKVPPPILAKKEKDVVGGVAFTWYKKPDEEDIGLWVNALYVIPEQRRKGIGSSLLNIAMKNIELGYGLFALTDIPALYVKYGWSILSRNSTSYVLKYEKVT